MANISSVTIEMVGGARLTVRQDGNTVEITADTDAKYEVIRFPGRHSVLEMQFAPAKAHRRQGLFLPAEHG